MSYHPAHIVRPHFAGPMFYETHMGQLCWYQPPVTIWSTKYRKPASSPAAGTVMTQAAPIPHRWLRRTSRRRSCLCCRLTAFPAVGFSYVGFRVATVIPEPSTGLLVMTGVLGLAVRRGRRRRDP